MSRRHVILGAGAATAGAVAAGVAQAEVAASAERGPLPFYGGYASAIRPDLVGPSCAGGSVHWWGDRTAQRVALTFDDGPHPTWTPALLEALAAEDVPATFFVKGVNVRAHPQVHAHSVGHHEIGNHTWDHPDLGRLDHAGVASQIARCTAEVEDVLGVTPRLFRPPYGHLGGSTVLAASEAGLPIVLWSAQMRESRFVDHPDGVVGDVVHQVHGGSIVLAHDAGADTRLVALRRVRTIVRQIRDAGHELVTVSELLGGTPHPAS